MAYSKKTYAAFCRWRNKNRQYLHNWNKQHHLKDPRIRMLHQARVRSKKKGYICTIIKEDIAIPEVCPILGIPLFPGDNERIHNSPSLDRIKPELGYIPGNIQVISWRANKLKADAKLEELEKLVAHLKRIQ